VTKLYCKILLREDSENEKELDFLDEGIEIRKNVAVVRFDETPFLTLHYDKVYDRFFLRFCSYVTDYLGYDIEEEEYLGKCTKFDIFADFSKIYFSSEELIFDKKLK